MDDIQNCPICGAPNAENSTYCGICAQPTAQAIQFTQGLLPLPQYPQNEYLLSGQRHIEQTQQITQPIKIVRTSNAQPIKIDRRKLLVGLLGSAAILTVGSAGLWQLAQNMQVVTLNTKNYPYHFWDHLVGESYSPDLNFMAMVKVNEMDNQDAKLYIWDYQQQRMTTLPTGPDGGDPAWSPDNRYLLSQMYYAGNPNTLNLWDVQKQQKLLSYIGEDYSAFSEIHWSPDGSQIALCSTNFVIMSPAQLKPLFAFQPPDNVAKFVWSPDSQKIAFLINENQSSSWGIQIWDLQSRKMESEITLQGQSNYYESRLAWSPDGTHIAAMAREQIQIVKVGEQLTSYALNEPNEYGELAWSPGGKYLAVAVQEPGNFLAGSKFSVWDIVERKRVRVFNRDMSSLVPDALAWSKDGKYIRMIADVYKQENWNWQ